MTELKGMIAYIVLLDRLGHLSVADNFSVHQKPFYASSASMSKWTKARSYSSEKTKHISQLERAMLLPIQQLKTGKIIQCQSTKCYSIKSCSSLRQTKALFSVNNFFQS